MNVAIEMLFKKMTEDKSFAEKILLQTEKEKVIELAKAEGITLTLEDIEGVNEIIRQTAQPKNEGELSEEELENVAGGTMGLAILCAAGMTACASAMVSLTAGSAISVVVPTAVVALTVMTEGNN